jgi:diguanylate cyclase (GGDEF)-like protein
MRYYAAGFVLLIGVYPVLPQPVRGIGFLVVLVSAIPCVAYGRRLVVAVRRRPWTLLLAALVVIVIANVVQILPVEHAVPIGWLLDAAGNVLAFAAALGLILQRGSSDLGGIIDTALVALAVGGLLWGLALPHKLGSDDSLPAQLNLFVVVFALAGALGALLRLWRTLAEPVRALQWLMSALGLGIGANVVLAIAGDNPTRQVIAEILFMAAFAALGLFGLDPSGPRLATPGATRGVELLSTGRLLFLGVAVAVVPVINGVRDLLGRSVDGLLVAVQGAFVAALVMIRIGILSAQRAEAERALSHQAAHDPLTQLLNRREFIARLGAEVARGRRGSLLFCDLDGFKSINDRFGHSAGDQLLIDAANRIEACVPAPNLVSRFGGDEFVILLVDASSAEVEATRACIAAAMNRPFASAREATIEISIGVSPADHEQDPDQLISSADRAMYQAKARHGNVPPSG